jgi:hypothetical protein
MEYSEEFIDENNLKESIKPELLENDVDLDDYKDIHEHQKLQTKLNFFENSIDSTIAKKPQGFTSNNVVNSFVIDKKNKENLQSINANNNYKSNPMDRIPRDISSNNIQKLNSIFDKYKGSLNSQNINNNNNGNGINNKINKKSSIEDNKQSRNLSNKNHENIFSFEVKKNNGSNKETINSGNFYIKNISSLI